MLNIIYQMKQLIELIKSKPISFIIIIVLRVDSGLFGDLRQVFGYKFENGGIAHLILYLLFLRFPSFT